MQGRTQEFGSPADLAANPQLQAAAAADLLRANPSYSDWQADLNNPSVAAAMPTAQQAVSDAQAGNITLGPTNHAAVPPPPGSTGGTTSSTTGLTGTYQAAASSFGKVLQEIDSFYNPKISLLPSWTTILGGQAVNSATGTIVTLVDRIVGGIFGIGLVYMGIKLMTGGSSDRGGSTLNTVIRTGGQVVTGREASLARQVTSQGRSADVAARTATQRHVAAQSGAQRAADRSAREAQAVANAAARSVSLAQQKRAASQRNKRAKERIDIQRAAEARRQEETGRVTRRTSERIYR